MLVDVVVIGFRFYYNVFIVGDLGGLIVGLDLFGMVGEDVGYINYVLVFEIFCGEMVMNLLVNVNWNIVVLVFELVIWVLWLVGVVVVGLLWWWYC